MIQRIQTAFLFLISITSVLGLFFFPPIDFPDLGLPIPLVLKSYLILTAKSRDTLHKSLRSPGILGYKFSIEEMNSTDREKALQQLLRSREHAFDLSTLPYVAKECTKGFVLRDLADLVSNAIMKGVSLEDMAKRIEPLRLKSIVSALREHL